MGCSVTKPNKQPQNKANKMVHKLKLLFLKIDKVMTGVLCEAARTKNKRVQNALIVAINKIKLEWNQLLEFP